MAPSHVTVHQVPGSRTLTLYCARCAASRDVGLPVRLTELEPVLVAFAGQHEACAKREEPSGPF